MSLVSTILTGVGSRLFSESDKSISSTSEPTITECIQWLNEASLWMIGICAERKSELGRTTGSITTEDGKDAYTDFASDMYAPYEFGWIEKTSSRVKIILTTEEALLDYSPNSDAEAEPDKFYINGSNNVVLLQTPDTVYTVKIPYWQIPTALTVDSDTVPFFGIFDNLYIETIVLRAQNREEYDLAFELKWHSFIKQRVERVIELRKNMNIRVEV